MQQVPHPLLEIRAVVFYCSMVGSLCAGGYTGGDTTINGANLDIAYTMPGYIENLPSPLDAVRYDDQSVNVETGSSGQFDVQSIALVRDGYYLGFVDVDFEENRDWSGVHGEIDPVNRKSVVSGVASAPGSASPLALMVLKETGDTRVGICEYALSVFPRWSRSRLGLCIVCSPGGCRQLETADRTSPGGAVTT